MRGNTNSSVIMFDSSSVIIQENVMQLDLNVIRGNGTGTLTPNYTLVDLQLLSNKKATTLIPVMVIIGVLILVGVTGNLLVCYIFYRRLKSNIQHFFILSLAVIDLISCTVAMPAEIADMIYFYTFSSGAACKILRFVNYMSTFSSVFTLMTIAIDRFRKICRPHGTQMNRPCARRSLILIFALALLCSWPAPIIYGISSVDVGYSPIMGQDCTINDGVSNTAIPLVFNFLLLFGFITLTVTIVVLYSLILIGLRKHNRTMNAFKFDVKSSSQITQKTRLCRVSQMQAFPLKTDVKSTRHGGESKHETYVNKFLKRISINDNAIESDSVYCSGGNGTLDNDNETPTKPAASVECPDRDSITENASQEDHCLAISLSDITSNKRFSTVSLCVLDIAESTSVLSHEASTTHTSSNPTGSTTHTSNPTGSTTHTSNPTGSPTNIANPTTSPTDIVNRTPAKTHTSKVTASPSDITNPTASQTDIANPTASPSNTHDSCASIDAISLHEFNSCSFPQELHCQPKTQSHESLSPRISGTPRSRNITSKTTTIAFAVTVVFILSYLPHIILQVVKFADDLSGQDGTKLVVFNLLIRSYFINSVANPVIYGVFNVQFRQEVRLLMTRILCRKRP